MDVLIESEPLPGVSQWVMNRPGARNALDAELIGALRERLARHNDRSQTRVVVLRAAGAAFCSGLNLRRMGEAGADDPEQHAADAAALVALFSEMAAFEKPLVASVQGPAFGAGAGLVAVCDVALGAEEAKFCFPEVRLGLVPAVISPYVLEAIGHRHARRYLLTGEMIGSERAREIGLLHDVVPAQALGGEAFRVATELAQGGPEALRLTKVLMRTTARWPAGAGRDSALGALLADRLASDEARTGIPAMLARRAPPWTP